MPLTSPPRRSKGHSDDSDARAITAAIEQLERLKDQRFFVWLHLFGPHDPHQRWDQAPQEWSPYAQDVHHTDRELARLFDMLEKTGLSQTTMVVLTADHGEGLGEYGRRGHGNNLFDGGVHVPLLVAGPSVVPGDIRQAVGLIDIAPTILRWLGEPVPTSFLGYDLGPGLRGEVVRRPPVLLETWRLSQTRPVPGLHRIGAIDGSTKVMIDLVRRSVFAYDLARDANELQPLDAHSSPPHEHLLGHLTQWAEEHPWHPPRGD